MTLNNGLRPMHPGIFLKESLESLGASQADFARAIGISPARISRIINGTRPVTAELALLFGRVFGQSPQYWINLQTAYDLKCALREMTRRLSALRPLVRSQTQKRKRESLGLP